MHNTSQLGIDKDGKPFQMVYSPLSHTVVVRYIDWASLVEEGTAG